MSYSNFNFISILYGTNLKLMSKNAQVVWDLNPRSTVHQSSTHSMRTYAMDPST